MNLEVRETPLECLSYCDVIQHEMTYKVKTTSHVKDLFSLCPSDMIVWDSPSSSCTTSSRKNRSSQDSLPNLGTRSRSRMTALLPTALSALTGNLKLMTHQKYPLHQYDHSACRRCHVSRPQYG